MYITREDIKAAVSLAELTQLTNDIGGSTEPDWAVVDRAIAYACEIADGYLMGRYTLPLEPVPSILRPVCSDTGCIPAASTLPISPNLCRQPTTTRSSFWRRYATVSCIWACVPTSWPAIPSGRRPSVVPTVCAAMPSRIGEATDVCHPADY